MANDFTGNFREKIRNVFAESFESSRVLLNTVDTSLFRGAFNPNSGPTAVIKRPHQYAVLSTAAGDISSSTKGVIESGSITCTKQNVATVALEWGSVKEATEMNQLEEILRPAAEELVIDTEAKLGAFAIKNLGLTYGAPDTDVDAWSDVAGAGAMLKSIGAPMSGQKYYVMNPFTTMALSDAQNGLSASDRLVQTAWETAQVSSNFGGMSAITSNALSSFTNTTAADLVGALSATPTATHASVMDDYRQTWAVTGFTASAVVKAGSTIEVTGRYNINTRNDETIRGTGGDPVKFRAVVVADVTLDGSGEGDLVVSGAGIYEAAGAYNTVDSALTSGDVLTIIGTSATEYQPNLYYSKNALSVTSVPQTKLYSTDTIMTTKDGLQIRISKYADGDKNENMIRFDLIPAFAVVQPFWGGQGYGK